MAKQSDLESQQNETLPAYDPKVQVDMAVQAQARVKNTIGSTFSESRVLTTYDARPINGHDFITNGGTLVGGA